MFERPKTIADVRGVSYSYSLFWQFGVLRVTEEAERKMWSVSYKEQSIFFLQPASK